MTLAWLSLTLLTSTTSTVSAMFEMVEKPVSCFIHASALEWANFSNPNDGYVSLDSSAADFKWERRSGGTLTSGTGPISDHTGDHIGNYYYIEASNKPEYSIAILRSPTFQMVSPSTSADCLLRFYYHMYSSTYTMGDLTVHVLAPSVVDPVSPPAWRSINHQSTAWRLGSFRLPSGLSAFRLEFDGSVGSTARGDIAIDDVYLISRRRRKPCQVRVVCTPPPRENNTIITMGNLLTDYYPQDRLSYSCQAGFTQHGPSSIQCQSNGLWTSTPPLCTCSSKRDGSFSQVLSETNFTNSFQGYKQVRTTDYFDWKRRKGATPSPSTGPRQDRTDKNGVYAFIETSTPRFQFEYAILRSPIYENVNNSDNCLFTFWYHMYGEHTGQLLIAMRATSPTRTVFLWELTGNQGNEWQTTNVSLLSSMDSFQIDFYGVVGSGDKGDIAIDDFNFWSTCKTNPCKLRVKCSKLGAPKYGGVTIRVSPNNQYVAEYACDLNYIVNGNRQRTCTNSGSWDGKKPSCVPDLCALGRHDCHTNATCNNVPPSYVCLCDPLFIGDGRTCVELNKCTSLNGLNVSVNVTSTHMFNESTCHISAAGDCSCLCDPGFSVSRANVLGCEDINECHVSNVSCQTNRTCMNTYASYACVCRSGYHTTSCIDVDECLDETHTCDPNANCVNNDGSFRCHCHRGFIGDGFLCTDVNECQQLPFPCDTHAVCANTAASFYCLCKDGYTGNGVYCNDTNECDSGEEVCDNTTQCRNIDGSFHCCNDKCRQMHECRLNEELKSCGTACEPTCAEQNPTCTKECVLDVCQCLRGFVRDEGGHCVREAQCDQEVKPTSNLQETTGERAGPAAQPSSGGSAAMPAAGGAAALVFVILLILLLLFLRRRQRERQSRLDPASSLAALQGRTFNNAVYSESAVGTIPNNKTVALYSTVEGSFTFAPNGSAEVSRSMAVNNCQGAFMMENPVYDDTVAPVVYETFTEPADNEEALYGQLSTFVYEHIKDNEITLGHQLGEGEFGTVYQASYSKPGCSVIDVAVKTLKQGSSKHERVKCLQEAALMAQFHHENVVHLYGVVEDTDKVVLVLELMGSDLRSYLQEQQVKECIAVQRVLIGFGKDISAGMAYLSQRNFIHRDLAARNILLNTRLVCKIGDFGMSRELADEDYYVSSGGKIPLRWTAPEAINYRQYSTASDVWSFAVVLFEIYNFGGKPYLGWSNEKVLAEVRNGYRLEKPPMCPTQLYELMLECWNDDTHQRPNFLVLLHKLSSLKAAMH